MKKTIHSEHAKIIADHLVSIRKKTGMTQRELAKKLKREHSFVAHYELGERRIDLAEFYWLCLACEVSPHIEASELMKKFAQLE